MNIFLILVFLFFIGSTLGWCIEVIYRKFFSSSNPQRKWINPGFLVGPCLPLYGTSLCILFLLASLESHIAIEDPIAKKLVLFGIMAVCVTCVEFAVGILSIKVMKIRLWDYRDMPGNIMGVVCPLFTFFWMLLSAGYYFLIHEKVISALIWLSKNLAFSFVLGFVFAIFLIDFIYSGNLLVKIRSFARKYELEVKLDEFQQHVADIKEKRREAVFLLAMHSKTASFNKLLLSYHSRLARRDLDDRTYEIVRAGEKLEEGEDF